MEGRDSSKFQLRLCRIVARRLSGNASPLPGDKASVPRKLYDDRVLWSNPAVEHCRASSSSSYSFVQATSLTNCKLVIKKKFDYTKTARKRYRCTGGEKRLQLNTTKGKQVCTGWTKKVTPFSCLSFLCCSMHYILVQFQFYLQAPPYTSESITCCRQGTSTYPLLPITSSVFLYITVTAFLPFEFSRIRPLTELLLLFIIKFILSFRLSFREQDQTVKFSFLVSV